LWGFGSLSTIEGMRQYLDVCAIYRNEAPHLREWIEFHRLVGAERFFLYDNGSTDEHLDVLAPYLADGTVVIHDWPSRERPQEPAYDHCLSTHRDEARWIAFLDLDEYLFSPTLRPLPEVLDGFERYPGVVVNWAMFGTSGHLTPPAGLTIESFDRRKDYPPGSLEQVKSIVDPSRAAHAVTGHLFTYTEGHAANELHEVVDGPAARKVAFDLLRINHYAHRSRKEYIEKLARPQVVGTFKQFPPNSLDRRIKRSNAVQDDTIKAYVPALRKRLAALGSVSGPKPSGGAGAPSSART
jgi:Glycosyltransferase family 92